MEPIKLTPFIALPLYRNPLVFIEASVRCSIKMKLLIAMAVLGLMSITIPVAANVVNVAQEQRILYQRDIYLIEVLEQALKAANYSAELNFVAVHPHQQRTLLMLSQGEVDIHWGMTSTAREQLATAIKVPLFKGLIGWRVLLINQEYGAQFAAINDASQLKSLKALQGHDWPDTKILTQNGYTVLAQANYEQMFKLLALGRGDYFPRSVIEVHSELAARKDLPLMIEPHLLLKYPTAFYFFVNKEKVELSAALQTGLTTMLNNGEFDAIFARYFAHFLTDLKLEERRVFELESANL